ARAATVGGDRGEAGRVCLGFIKFCVRALNWAERMKQTSHAEQPNVPPPARLPPKSTMPQRWRNPHPQGRARKATGRRRRAGASYDAAWAKSSLARDDQGGPTRHAHQEAMAERSIALPHRCGCTGANRRTCLIWPATELSVSAVPARAWVFLRQRRSGRELS